MFNVFIINTKYMGSRAYIEIDYSMDATNKVCESKSKNTDYNNNVVNNTTIF